MQMAKATNSLQPQLIDRIDTYRAAKIYGRSIRTLNAMFNAGEFKTARRVGRGRGTWEVSRQEVICLKYHGKLVEI